MQRRAAADAEGPSPQIKAAAEKLYELAQRKNLTIRQFARKAGKPFQTFNNWKNGHTTAQLENLEAFARVVGATVTLAVKGSDEAEHSGLNVTHRETFVIARLVDEMPDEDREFWRKQIVEFAQWRRANPLKPAAEEVAHRDRSPAGSRR